MKESPSKSLVNKEIPPIAVEFVSVEEMALIEAALASTGSALSSSFSFSSSTSTSSSSSQFQINTKSIESIAFHTKKRLSNCSEIPRTKDIEDLGSVKKMKLSETFFHRFRRTRGLAITDITATEWCEKQMEFVLLRGKPRDSQAMKAGKARHTKLEQEVIKKVEVRVKTIEDNWALRFLNFIVCANQLLFEGLTRELPVIGLVEGVWMVGSIDEIRMPVKETLQNPILVDTKTRSEPTLPPEPQKRTGRLQLMCYKYLWDSLVTDNFQPSHFFTFFRLNPHCILSKEIQEHTAFSGFPTKTLEDVVRCFQNSCSTLPPTQDQLILRYEFQGDHSEIGEELFSYDPVWFMSRIRCNLEFWLGEREASYVPKEESWKCRNCQFASVCPINTTRDSSMSSNVVVISKESENLPASGRTECISKSKLLL